MKSICFVNGSPKTGESTSQYLIKNIREMLGDIQSDVVRIVDVFKKRNFDEVFAAIIKVDAVVFAFPLYIDSIPSSMLEFLYALNDYTDRVKGSRVQLPHVYAIVNEGFYGGTQNVNAINNIRHFCKSAGFCWRFGVGIGAGEYLRSSKGIPLANKSKICVYNALKKVADDILSNSFAVESNLFVDPHMTKRLFIICGHLFWIFQAKKNGVRLSALKARPFNGHLLEVKMARDQGLDRQD